MSRIKQRFDTLKAAGRRALIPYVVAGDPAPAITVPLMHDLVAAGADLIELGVPFSDPMAEGPTIQLAHERALANGITLRAVLEMVAEFRQRDTQTPLLLMGYSNPIERMGYARFIERAQAVGLDALLTVDMPPEEVHELNQLLAQADMDNIFLMAPTTPSARIEKIAELASGFVYYVSLKGVTGAGNLDTAEVAARLAEIKAFSDLPVAVGFGIKDVASAVAVAEIADGVVVGSALVQLLADAAQQNQSPEQIRAAAVSLVADMREAIDAI